jgi:replicative DNA helicase
MGRIYSPSLEQGGIAINIELGLISKIESKEDFLLVLDERIKPEFFEEHGEIFQTILDHYTKYQAVPERETLERVFPNVVFYEGQEPLQFFIDKIKEKQKKKIYSAGLAEVAGLLSENVDEAEKKLQKLLITAKTQIKTGVDLDMVANAETRIAEYQKRKETIGIDGYSTSWDYLDGLTCGFHNGELIVIIAKQKMCKTWILLWIARHIWREYGVPVVFVTREMGPKAIRRRFEAIECKLPYGALKSGLLTASQEKAYSEYLRKTEKNEEGLPKFVTVGFDLTDATSGVSSIVPKVEQYLLGGGVLFIDGLYLLPDDKGESDWKAMVNIATALKNLALGYNIPVVATTQHNLEDRSDIPRLEGAAYGKYIVQFADVILGISRSDTDRQTHRGGIHVLGQREGDIGNFMINMKFDPLDFSQLSAKYVNDDEEVYSV